MRFLLLKKQKGYGCDYTIGCGLNWEFFNASDWREARKKAKEILSDDHQEYVEITKGENKGEPLEDWEEINEFNCALGEAHLIQIQKKESLDVEKIENSINKPIQAYNEKIEKARRKAEYEKLKGEFE